MAEALRGRGRQNETRPLTTEARACVPTRGTALRGQDPDRETLPLTGRPWSSQVSYARLWPRRGRSARGAEWELPAWAPDETEQGAGWFGAAVDARGAKPNQGSGGQGRVCEVQRLTLTLVPRPGGLHIAWPKIIFTPTFFGRFTPQMSMISPPLFEATVVFSTENTGSRY
jgi:hypothetical protein